MEKKTVFLELPCELLDKIDRQNTFGDRSVFITNLLETQLTDQTSENIRPTSGLTTKMAETDEPLRVAGEIDLINDEGVSLGRFNLNTLEGFEDLARKIQDISDDPVVKIRARQWL
jgi:hypothetical protein